MIIIGIALFLAALFNIALEKQRAAEQADQAEAEKQAEAAAKEARRK